MDTEIWLAVAMALAGNPSAAFDLLERLPHGYSLSVLAPLPVFDALRGDPRFQRLLNEWREP